MEEIETQYQMSINKSNKFLIISVTFIFLFGCGNISNRNNSTNISKAPNEIEDTLVKEVPLQKNIVQEKQNIVFPDSTINNQLMLVDNNSTKNFYPDYNKLSYNDITDFSHPFILFVNNDISQYLIAYTYEGSTINAFDCFEIGYYKDNEKLNKLKYYQINEPNFKTESGLRLGMILNDLERIKGKGYNRKELSDKNSVLTYHILDMNSSSFLKRYNMPGYFMEITLKDEKIIKILFGFDYP